MQKMHPDRKYTIYFVLRSELRRSEGADVPTLPLLKKWAILGIFFLYFRFFVYSLFNTVDSE